MNKIPKRDLTRGRILHAATELIASIGVEKTTHRAIAKRAKAANGLVAHYFPKQELIFQAVIKRIAGEAYLTIEEPPADLSGSQKILHMVESNLRFFLDHPSYFKCFMLYYYYATFNKAFRAQNTELVRVATQRLQTYLRQHSSETGNTVDDATIETQASVLHNHLMGCIMKFFNVDHTNQGDAYQERCLKEVAEIILPSLARGT